MNVMALSDIFENSLQVQVRPDLILPVASLPGLIVLKLFAWLDRHEGRDVQDIRRLIETYTDAGNIDRLYEEADELEWVDFDTVLAGAFLLDKDARHITDEKVRAQLLISLSWKEIGVLVHQLARTISVLDDHTVAVKALLGGFFRGMGLGDFM